MIPQEIKQVYSKFKDYTYQDPDFSTYKIKTPTQFNRQQGGICWDFVGPIALELDKSNIPWECFYTVVNGTTHTYIISDNRYWIECSWQPYKGINTVDSYHDIEDLLKDYYGGTEIHTFSYDPTQTFGLTPSQFFDYLEQKGEYKGESNVRTLKRRFESSEQPDLLEALKKDSNFVVTNLWRNHWLIYEPGDGIYFVLFKFDKDDGYHVYQGCVDTFGALPVDYSDIYNGNGYSKRLNDFLKE